MRVFPGPPSACGGKPPALNKFKFAPRKRASLGGSIRRRHVAVLMPPKGGNSGMACDADAIIVGAGLAGLVATAELIDAGKTVIVLDQEPEQSLGGQAFWSLGGIFLVDSPEQRRLGIRDSHTLALQDWLGTAAFDRDEEFLRTRQVVLHERIREVSYHGFDGGEIRFGCFAYLHFIPRHSLDLCFR